MIAEISDGVCFVRRAALNNTYFNFLIIITGGIGHDTAVARNERSSLGPTIGRVTIMF